MSAEGKFGRREMRPTEEELVQLREWHAQYEARDDLDAAIRGYTALLEQKDQQIDRLARALGGAGVPVWLVEAIRHG